jgi:hypothetical protein
VERAASPRPERFNAGLVLAVLWCLLFWEAVAVAVLTLL